MPEKGSGKAADISLIGRTNSENSGQHHNQLLERARERSGFEALRRLWTTAVEIDGQGGGGSGKEEVGGSRGNNTTRSNNNNRQHSQQSNRMQYRLEEDGGSNGNDGGLGKCEAMMVDNAGRMTMIRRQGRGQS